MTNESERFTFFWGGPFSQWHPVGFTVAGVNYWTAEQYMMAMKARKFGDIQTEKRILASRNPREQKSLGRQVANFDAIVWATVARDIVYNGNYAKFTQNLNLLATLIDTRGTTLVEASPHDCIWGIGLSLDHPDRLDRTKWRGTNWLGEVLMKVRDHV